MVTGDIEFFTRTMAPTLEQHVEAGHVTPEGARLIGELYGQAAAVERRAALQERAINADLNLTATGKQDATRKLGVDVAEKVAPIRAAITRALTEHANRERTYPYLVRDEPRDSYRDIRVAQVPNVELDGLRLRHLLAMTAVERSAVLRSLAEHFDRDGDPDDLLRTALATAGRAAFLDLLDARSLEIILDALLAASGLDQPLQQSRYMASALARLTHHLDALQAELGVAPEGPGLLRVNVDGTLTPLPPAA